MASVFIDHTAVGANDGTTMADAYVSAVTAASNWASTDVWKLKNTHTEVLAAPLTVGGSLPNSPVVIESIDFATGLISPAVSTQFTSSTTNVEIDGSFTMFGVWIGDTTQPFYARRWGSKFKLVGGNIAATTYPAMATTTYHLIDSNLHINGGNIYDCSSLFRMEGGAVIGTVSVNGLFSFVRSPDQQIFIGVDFTGVIALYLCTLTSNCPEGTLTLVGCKGLTLDDIRIVRTATRSNGYVDFINSDALNTRDNMKRGWFNGSVLKSNYSIYLDSGFASRVSGTQQSYQVAIGQIASVNNVSRYTRITSPKLYGYIDTPGIKTFTVQFAHGYTSPIDQNQLALSVQASATSGSAALTQTFSNAGLDANISAALPTSVEAWTGAGSLTKQSISVTVTVEEPGFFEAELHFGMEEINKILYYNPVVDVT